MNNDPLGRGRPHKGDRVQRTVRVSRAMNRRLAADAESQGLTMSDFIANIVYAHYGEPPVARPRDPHEIQQRLAL